MADLNKEFLREYHEGGLKTLDYAIKEAETHLARMKTVRQTWINTYAEVLEA